MMVTDQFASESAMTTDTENLIKRAISGDVLAREELLRRYGNRLKKLVAVRMDARLSKRIDPSDVVQDTLLTAEKRLEEFLENPTVPMYTWLRSMALDRLADLYRRHVVAQRRSVTREHPWAQAISNASEMLLAAQLQGTSSTPSQHLMRDELIRRVRNLLGRMEDVDREIIIMRHLEGMKIGEIASVLQMPEGTVKSRHFRALTEMRRILFEE
jgi:RNA polymerase sigma-70 factor (ECF subfamily)